MTVLFLQIAARRTPERLSLERMACTLGYQLMISRIRKYNVHDVQGPGKSQRKIKQAGIAVWLEQTVATKKRRTGEGR